MTPPHELRLARVAAIVADPARSRMLTYLVSAEYVSASELAAAWSVDTGHCQRPSGSPKPDGCAAPMGARWKSPSLASTS